MRSFTTDDYLAWHCDWCDSKNLIPHAFHHDERLHCSACQLYTETRLIAFSFPRLHAA